MDPEVRPEASGPIEGRVERYPHKDATYGPYTSTWIHVDRPCRPFVTAPGEVPRCGENRGGDFYTDCQTCLFCDVPHIEAPDLMAYVQHPPGESGRLHCVFTRQPTTEAEIERAIRAIAGSEVCGIRYGGNDPEILRRIAETWTAEAADALRAQDPGA